jgi:hypothetical protein
MINKHLPQHDNEKTAKKEKRRKPHLAGIRNNTAIRKYQLLHLITGPKMWLDTTPVASKPQANM